MIPKKIYYCWFGKKALNGLQKRCIESWQEKLPEYEITKLDESNCDFSKPILKSFFKKKQWAFISDYLRLTTLYKHGGIYFDVDIEVIKSFDPLLNQSCFLGDESEGRPNTAVLGSIRNHPFLRNCIEEMDVRFEKNLPYKIAPEVAMSAIEKYDLDTPPTVYSTDFFYPFNPYDSATGKDQLMYSDITDNTYAIHHWAKSWSLPFTERVMRKILR